MVKLKLTLKSKRPSTIYASNGKPYRLQPGSNTIELEYEDYLALAKTLGIKPVDNSKLENTSKPVEKKEESTKKEEPKIEESEPTKEEFKVEESVEEEVKYEEPIDTDEELTKEVDYTSMSYNKLKAEYKAITGKYCKLKKDEVIAFLQEHRSNV